MQEWVTVEDVRIAYLDCRKRKRNTVSCADFEQNEARNIYDLWKELNEGTYEIGYSIAFVVTRPKLREVFAANFRDRIVHHLLIQRIGYLFESNFIDDTYNCRIGKGNLYGAKRLAQAMKDHPDYWNVKLDMQGFFYSINKELLWNKLEAMLRSEYKRSDLDKILWLTRMIVMHEPQNKCYKHGNPKLWEQLPKDRSLFTCAKGYGLAIGNLTSQILANFYLSDYDWEMQSRYDWLYRRYVDDSDTTCKHEDIPGVIEFSRSYLLRELQIRLHPRKVYIQPVRKGILFIGTAIKGDRTYTCNRTVNNVFRTVEIYNKLADDGDIETWIERFAQRINSYMGFMIHNNSYAIRWRVWNAIDERIKPYIYIENMCTIKVRKQYKQQIKTILQYGKKRIPKRRLLRDSSSLQN